MFRREFLQKLCPWLAIVALAIVATILTQAALPDSLRSGAKSAGTLIKFGQVVFPVAWFALFFAVSRKLPLWARGILFTILFLPAAFAAYVKYIYGIEIWHDFVLDSLATNWEEVREYISFSAVATVVAFVATMFVISWIVVKIPTKTPCSKIFTTIIVGVLAFTANQRNLRNYLPPANIVLETKMSIKEDRDRLVPEFAALAKSEDAPQEIRCVPAEISHVNAIPIVVLHIAESARADHAPFNGYGRNTLPLLLRESDAGNLISFPKCVSFSVRTVESARGILSPSTVLDNAFRHPTFLPALRQHGVETCGFFSRRKIGLRHFLGANTRDDLGTMLSFKSLRKKVCTDELAGTLLPKIREVLADAENGTPRQQFYLYYGEGSHVPFLGYDFDKHSVFTPNGKQKYNDERDVNNYDNTFIALDEFCAGFIDALRDKNAVYILVGDHGETLGEGGVWGRRYRNKETRHVLFFVWASEKFKAENPELWATLLRNRERLGVISHDFVYNSVLHLFSIETPYYDEHADLFSDAANPFPTEMPEAEGFGPLRFGENAETKIQFHGGKF